MKKKDQNYSQRELFPHPQEEEKPEDFPGIFSYSEVGGKQQDKQNPWQGSQERWEQP